MNAHRDALLRSLLERAEICGSGLARHFGKFSDVRFLVETGPRLVERDVAALPQAEYHKIEPAGRLNDSIIVRRVSGIRVRVRRVHGRKRFCRYEGRKRRTDRVRPTEPVPAPETAAETAAASAAAVPAAPAADTEADNTAHDYAFAGGKLLAKDGERQNAAPRKLYLGSRFAGFQTLDAAEAEAEYADVVSA